MIGKKPPSEYLPQIQSHPQVQITISDQDLILLSHLIDPGLLRTDDFKAFFDTRRTSLLNIISDAMGKQAVSVGSEPPTDDGDDEEEGEE
jgi:hypothetical protein